MLSVLPVQLEDTPWAAISLRKRPLPPSCLGEYHSASARAKRLRQELLLLREWEQRAYQERLGAYEGQGDSCDESFTIEPAQPPRTVHASPNGCIYFVEDVLETTSRSPVHVPLTEVESFKHDVQAHEATDVDLTPLTPLTLLRAHRRAASNPTNLQPVQHSALVHTLRATSLPNQAVFAASSSIPSVEPGSGTFPAVGLEVVAEDEEDWSEDSFKFSGSANPLEELIQGGISVEQPKPSGNCVSAGVSGPDQDGSGSDVSQRLSEEVVEVVAEENLPREETFQCCREEVGSGVFKATLDSGCLMHSLSSIVLPPLPRQFLGIPMSSRLRLLEFFVQASELLGLGTQSLYLAVALLDCCWVEEGRRKASVPGSTLTNPSLDSSELRVTALACLLHAYLCSGGVPEAAPSSRMVKSFCSLLSSGAAQYPRVGAMLPAKASVLVERLRGMQSLLPMAVARGSLSGSPWVYGSMLELRNSCAQKEHLVVFVSQLCAVGCSTLPAGVVGAANCCLLTGAVCCGQADSGRRHGCTTQTPTAHHAEHFKVLQDFLCVETVQSQTPVQDWCEEGLEAEPEMCAPEASVDLSV